MGNEIENGIENRIKLDLMNIITKIPKEAVKVMVEATMYHDGKIEIVHSGMNMAEIAEARRDFLDNVEDGDDYDAIYTITEEGERYLDELQQR